MFVELESKLLSFSLCSFNRVLLTAKIQIVSLELSLNSFDTAGQCLKNFDGNKIVILTPYSPFPSNPTRPQQRHKVHCLSCKFPPVNFPPY